ncbi:hypothetical protein C1H46_045119 [Malus baccata]|uniref:Uncharacterized protein n=1 Tax=Malus baccata TaxID=106549 RepID=A0A540K537_MALBA|nr:hypothetical protein C1H46_045119 [Malus baccata]
MPRYNPNTRLSQMDARVAALESSIAALSDSIDSKMVLFFEQFRREQACACGSGGSTSDADPPPQPLIADPHNSGDLDPYRPRPAIPEGGLYPPRHN